MTSLENPVYRFADFELEPTERRLRAAGVPVDLPPKVLDTLVFLVQHAGRAVSKDELLRAVWPRGFIDESNLNKHVWLIRRALGDGEHGTRFIETVPKLGFRFVAPVSVTERSATRTVAPAVAIEPLAVVPATPHRMRAAAWSVAAVAIAGIALFALTRHRPLAVMAPPSGRAVAIASFRNLSQNPKDAWLGPALTAMLGTELSVANRLRVVPEALVRDVHVEATASGAGGYAPAALQRFHDAVGADYVVVGTYLVSGTADDAPVRVDVAVQDARSGATVVAISRQDPLSSLLGVVKQAGVQLRAGLAAGDTDAAALQQLANAQPPSAAIARRVGFALEALQHYDAARARDELLDAIAEAPGYAPAYRALARAWMMLGYRDKAIAAGEQAMSRAANLPSAERLEIDAVLQTTRNAWPAAAARWRELVALRPAVPEYRLELIDALLAVGNVVAAQAALAELRMLGSSGADPRVELADARIAHARDNSRDAASHAAAALRLSQQQGTESLAADAHLELATAHLQLGELDEARTDANAAIDAYRRVGNPSGEATGLQLLGSAFDDSNHQQQAREAYQRALALDQGIGDLSGIGEIYKDLCSMLWVAGDRDGAQAAARKGLAISREIANVTLEAWTTRALATIAADESASDSVVEDYRRVEQLGERSSNHGGHVWTLVTLADVERLRGELDAASRDCEQAKAEAASISDEQFRMYADFTCAVLDIDRGQPQPAQRALQQIAAGLVTRGTTVYIPNAQMMLGQLAMDAARWADGCSLLETASRGFAAGEIRTGEADAQALLALCANAAGLIDVRDRAAARARELRRSITSRQEVLAVEISLAQLPGAAASASLAIAGLEHLAADAEHRRWLAWALEARLAAWRLASAAHATAVAGRLARDLRRTAGEHGFVRIVRLLDGPTPPAAMSPRG